MAIRDSQKPRAAQAGFLMRAYRESFQRKDGRRGLTQDDLLRLMAEVDVDGEYGERYSHATVSRWETGQTSPSVERFRTFGKALELSDDEVAGLILLSGLAPDYAAAVGQANGKADAPSVRRAPADEAEASSAGADRQQGETILRPLAFGKDVVRFLLLRFLPLAVGIAALGLVMEFLGGDLAWVPVTFVALAVCLALGQGFLLGDPEAGLREFFWVTLFVLLTTPLLHFAPLSMDHYNFYSIVEWGGTSIAYMLALLLNLALSASAGLAFHLLWRWQNTGARSNRSAHLRAAWAVLPPTGVVFVTVVVLSNAWVWMQLAAVMLITAAVFVVLLVIRDPMINPSESDRRFVLSTVFTVAVVGTVLGMATVLAIYLAPNVPMVLPDHNLVWSWDLNYEQLGYTRQEALDLLKLGYLWHATSLFAYMAFVVGGTLIVAVFRMGSGNVHQAEDASALDVNPDGAVSGERRKARAS
ncbi:MAG: helix-turn-helix transcriptional regulator [Chloroflexi bacterium]|nr:helix-turn-helix transcriptional regulator [Chloroflexota bacterium]